MKNTILRILKYCRSYWGYFILTVICTLAGISLSLIVPVMIGKAVDSAIGVNQVDFTELRKIVLTLGAMILISTLFQFLESLFHLIS